MLTQHLDKSSFDSSEIHAQKIKGFLVCKLCLFEVILTKENLFHNKSFLCSLLTVCFF